MQNRVTLVWVWICERMRRSRCVSESNFYFNPRLRWRVLAHLYRHTNIAVGSRDVGTENVGGLWRLLEC